MATTGICNSFKVELLQAGHCFNPTTTLAVTNSTGSAVLSGISSTAGLAVGMSVTGTGAPASTTIKSVDSATQVTMSAVSTSAVTSATFTADVFKLLLIKVGPSLTYSATQTNVGTPGTGTPTTANVGTDEASGTGYTTGGITLSNVLPALSSTTATTSFSPSPSLTGATISTTAGIIYNSSVRLGAAAAPLGGRTVGVYDFGGTQSVSGGTITFTMPVNAAGTAIIQLA